MSSKIRWFGPMLCIAISCKLYVSMNTIKVVFAFANSADADCYLFTTQRNSFYKENFLLMKSLKKFQDITWEIFGIPNSIYLIMEKIAQTEWKCAIACH